MRLTVKNHYNVRRDPWPVHRVDVSQVWGEWQVFVGGQFCFPAWNIASFVLEHDDSDVFYLDNNHYVDGSDLIRFIDFVRDEIDFAGERCRRVRQAAIERLSPRFPILGNDEIGEIFDAGWQEALELRDTEDEALGVLIP